MDKIKVILVDEQVFMRHGVRNYFESNYPDIAIVGEAKYGHELFKLLKKVKAVDIVILEIISRKEGVMSGTDIIRRLNTEHPDIKILVLSGENSTEMIDETLKLGINGFYSKNSALNNFAEAIYSIMQGNYYFGNDISGVIYELYLSNIQNKKATSLFTKQQKRIIELCYEGKSGNTVAEQLGIKLSTVNNHKREIFKKLGVNSTAEMVRYAKKNGMIRTE